MVEGASEFILPSTGWLASLSEEERKLFSSFGEVFSVEPKKALIRQDETQPYFFFVLKGMLSIRRGDAVVAVVASGEFLGEMTIGASGKASATVVALEPCEVWRMSHETLTQFIYAHKDAGIKILLAFLSTVSERLQAVNSDLADLLSERRRQGAG